MRPSVSASCDVIPAVTGGRTAGILRLDSAAQLRFYPTLWGGGCRSGRCARRSPAGYTRRRFVSHARPDGREPLADGGRFGFRSLLRAVPQLDAVRRNPDDPFDDLFRQLEQFMEEVMDQGVMPGATGPAGRGAPGSAQTDTHVDVHEYDDYITVIADLPGVEKADIDVSCDGSVLSIQAENDSRRYDERLQLPSTVDETSGAAKYNNGVLEVRFDRAGDTASIDVE